MSVATLLSSGEEGIELPLHPLAFGGIAFALLVVLLLVTLSFGKDR